MVTIVGQDKISAKRDLRNIFPKEFANRLLINEFITYILNNFFEKSNEKIVSAYVGEKVPSIDGMECYVKEPTPERQMNQIIPVLKAGNDYITYNNFMADLHNEGCKIYDQNKLLAGKHWSWCPPINADMFLNYNNYYWIGWDLEESNIRILKEVVDVKSIIGLNEYTYIEHDAEGMEIPGTEYTFKNNDRVVFLNDTSNEYMYIPYVIGGLTEAWKKNTLYQKGIKVSYTEIVGNKEVTKIYECKAEHTSGTDFKTELSEYWVETDTDTGYLTLKPVQMPLIVLGAPTNAAADILGHEQYTYVDIAHELTFDFVNGMRIMFVNDNNKEYNNVIFMVNGVGTSITLTNDMNNPFVSLDNTTKDDTGLTEYEKATKTPDYCVMERGCLDGNEWSIRNRWVHRLALERFNTSSIESSSTSVGLPHGACPIMCYNKDIELYNYGTFDRGYITSMVKLLTPSEIASMSPTQFTQSTGDVIKNGDNILCLNVGGSNPIQLYNVTIITTKAGSEKIILKTNTNGQSIGGKQSDGSTQKGDVIKLIKGTNITTYYYNGSDWVIGQSKDTSIDPETGILYNYGINKPIYFNLYDSDKVILDNPVTYPQSTFAGCKLFDYKVNTAEDRVEDRDLNRYIVTSNMKGNYLFENHIETDSYYYTPINDYQKEFMGYRFFKLNSKDEYYNDWYLNKSAFNQYIKTQIEANDKGSFVDIKDENDIVTTYYKIGLEYTPAENAPVTSLLVYKNGDYVESSDLIIEGKTVLIKNVKLEDIMDVYVLTTDNISKLSANYTYETPLSLTVNQLNEEIETIAYNNCFDQMIDIIENQKGLIGKANGSNNYSSLKVDLSVGSKIAQHASTIIRTMILNNDVSTSVRSSIEYVENAYIKFKNKFNNLLNQMYIKGIITDEQESEFSNPATEYVMDEYIKEIIEKINVGKEGLMPFYNNGVMHLLDNCYIPSTPAYLGITNCYQPRIEEFKAYVKADKPMVIVGHDGSMVKTTGTVKDLVLLRLETLIYDSINPKFKDTRCGVNKFEFIPGYFRQNTYTREEVIDTYSTFIDKWANENGLDYSENINFEYDLEENPEAWKTWNYGNTFTVDGERLQGSYRAIYQYYYDTFRPDTHPWEMLGFGDKPSWWNETYGEEPYTSSNIVMWQDIENGIIKGGEWKGEYKELKRPGLVEKYIPVDTEGKLKSPMDIGIIQNIPNIQNARARWKLGDLGDVEFAYIQTSASKYTDQITTYLLRPTDWVETNWNTLDRTTLFKGTDYEQIIDSATNFREDLSKIVMHNELDSNGKYIQKIGIQQWISDYLVSEKLSISNVADKIRNSFVSLGYRCSGFYQKGTIGITTDSYGELPEENIHFKLFKSKDDGILTYSAMIIEKTHKGYIIDGFDKTFPYFMVRKPETTGKRTSVEEEGKSVYYYLQWKDEVEQVPYRKEFYSIQDVYDIINGYGKYLEENENWYFTTRNTNGEITNFRTSSNTFLKWAAVQMGEETDGNILVINPGVLGLGNYNAGTVEDLGLKINGQYSILDIYGNPIDAKEVNVLRQTYNTYVQPKDSNIGMLKMRTYQLEHLLVLDNKSLYGDTLYEPKYSTVLGRFNLSGVKVKNWYGTVYAPGYLLTDDGAIPNYDKNANDLQYMFDTDDVHCQGTYAEYSRSIINYKKNKTYKDLFKNDKAMFDFYKGAIADKGTFGVINRMNRSSFVSSTGNGVKIYENWAFKAGEFGHTSDNSVIEFLLDQNKMKQNPQVITFETSTDYYYDVETTYNKGDIVIYHNYEYICLNDNTTGVWDDSKWKMNRFVGNYIIFWEDERWIKKQKNKLMNCFKYTDDIITNPIGGFAKIGDVDYIVGDETEFETVKELLSIGETVWVVKTENGDFDIRKKTGVNKFISMRYNTLKDAVEQKPTDFIYHFRDDNKDYYSTKNSNEIQLLDKVYSDIDINNVECRWCDIGSPEYTGKVGEYVNGTDYKVKLYNTVFKTMIDEDHLNNSTTLRELYNDTTLVTYSNLLLNMVQQVNSFYKYKWRFRIEVQTKSSDVSITINDTTYNQKVVDLIVCEGDTINWTTSAFACGTRSGSVRVEEVIDGYEDLPEEEKANDNIKRQYHILQPLSIIVPMSYRDGSIIVDTTTPMTKQYLPLLYEGDYEMSLVGGGGGAGGYVTERHRVSHGMHRRSKTFYYAGCSGASAAYLHGKFKIDNSNIETDTRKYYVTNGNGGIGGAYNVNGVSGSDTSIYQNELQYIYAQAGAGGAKGLNNGNVWVNGRRLGYGGILQSDTELTNRKFTKNSDSKNGNNGGTGSTGGNPGRSVYPGSTYGEGGKGSVGNGTSGINGYTKIIFRNSVRNAEYTDEAIITNELSAYSMELDRVEGSEYSAYYQPYVIPPENGEVIYFYSYDALYEDDIRPHASIVNNSSKFYRNRVRSITGYHKPNIIMNLWSPHTTYKVGDTATYSADGVNHVYYKCLYEHTSGQNWEETKEIEKEGTLVTVTLWEEYAPTYYYKITYNKGIGHIVPESTYLLYFDKECSKPVLNQAGTTNVQMNCGDLKNYSYGYGFSLVDEIGTYEQISPRYMHEPSWGVINQVGTYDVSSGSVSYYVTSDKETIESDEDSLVYMDINCTQPAQSLITKEDNPMDYTLIDMKYTDLTNTKTDHMNPSYELKDNDLYLYTTKTINEITLEEPVYDTFTLDNVIGKYGDYIPQWEKCGEYNVEEDKYEYTPLTYRNNIKYIDYRITDASENAAVKTYTVDIQDGNNDTIDLYYTNGEKVVIDEEEYQLYYHYSQPSIDDNGNIDFCKSSDPTIKDKIRFYILNEPTHIVDTYADLLELPTSGLNNKVYKVKNDETKNNSTTYYKYVNNKWVGGYNSIDVLTYGSKDLFFTPYYDDVKVVKVDNTSELYIDTDYQLDVINPKVTVKIHPESEDEDVTYKNGITSSIKMYFNPQCVGRYLESSNLIEETDNLEKLNIMYTDLNDDYFYKFLLAVDEVLIGLEAPIDVYRKLVKEIYDNFNTLTAFLDYDEAMNFVEKNNFKGLALKYTKFYNEHTCKVYNIFRNELTSNSSEGSATYTKLYLFGDKLYTGKYVLDTQTDELNLCGTYFGTIDTISTYTRVENVVPHVNEDKIVNVIEYKTANDYLYIKNDCYSLIPDSAGVNSLSDTDNLGYIEGTYGNPKQSKLKNKKGWMVVEYIDRDYMFNLVSIERQRIATKYIKSCYLVDNEDDSTISKVQIFDPIQNIIPNNVLDEINYISSIDPVNNYEDDGKWNDQKVGYLWWDTSKVRYVDYYQGDYEYRRQNWGKQLPGSEIVINEWIRSTEAPTDGRNYITKSSYNYELDSIITYYYYWTKNPVEIPEVSFRKTSALTIASIINNPTDEGIVWMSPIDSNISGRQENTLVISNFNEVMRGQQAVLQINMDSDKDILDHTEWALVKEKTNADIPEFLWEKMKDSLLGYKDILTTHTICKDCGHTVIGKVDVCEECGSTHVIYFDKEAQQPVPDPTLKGRQKLGIAFRPRQTMFDKVYNARENLIDVVNDIFKSRTFNNLSQDITSWLVNNTEMEQYPKVIDEPNEDDYFDVATNKLEMMSWRDIGLIGQRILVKNDETLNNIWSIYEINPDWTYTLVKYQRFNMLKYVSYIDWYMNDDITYLTPTYEVTTTEADAVELCRTLSEGKIVKYINGDNWELFQLQVNDGLREATLVGKSNTLLQIKDSIYNYVNEGYDSTKPYIVTPDKTLTHYDYIYEETQYLIKCLIEYFEL